MRLLGGVDFTVKAVIICIAFLVPLTWLAWSFYANKEANIGFSAKERLGVEYNRVIIPLLDLAQQYRREASATAVTGQATAALSDLQSRMQQGQARLADVQKRLGADLGTADAYKAALAAWSAAEQAKGLENTFLAHTAHVDALNALLLQAADGSNLTLDPDIDSYYLMDAVFFRLPDMAEASNKLRGLGLSILKGGEGTQAQRQLFIETVAIAEFQFRNMRDGLAKAYANNATLAPKIRSTEVLADAEALFNLSRKTVLADGNPQADAAPALLAAAEKAVGNQYAVATRLLDELDGLLVKRIDGMVADRTLVTAVLVLGLLCTGYLFHCFYLVASGGLSTLAQHLDDLSGGDLRHQPAAPWGRDETARVMVDLAQTYTALHGLIRKVRHGARELHTASNEIASGSADLAARTEASASALEQQASAMEQIASTVGNTATHAQQAAKFASDNAHVAERGGAVISQVVATMQGIHASSNKINDIIGVIDGIAFQTNILALNAAVEAARAGEAGRGFAVGASEVRQLAQRSAGAAKEIKALISESVVQVDAGTRVVQGAGATMSEVVANARQINVYLSEIATSAQEQALGVQQVGQSIQELDRTTQQNASLVEQTTAAASALREQAEVLQQEIANFRVV